MPHAPVERQKIAYLAILGTGLLVLVPFLLLTLYNHPQADDFGFAVRDNTFNFWETQVNFYLNWSGRYFSTASTILSPVNSHDFDGYKLYSFLLIMLFAASIYLLIYTLLNKSCNPLQFSALAVLFISLYILQLPSVSEGLFWMPGLLAYQLPNIMMLMVLALLVSFFQTGNQVLKLVYIGLAAVLCIAIVGSNEMSIVMAFTTVLLLFYLNWKDTQNRPYLAFLLFICTVACLVAVLAPGNYARMEDHPDGKKPLWALTYAAFLTILSFYRWLAPVLIASVLYVIYWGLPLADKKVRDAIFRVDLRVSLLYYLVTLFLMQFAYTWAVGERPTPRVENVIYFFFVFGWFYNLQVALTTYGHLLRSERNLSPALPVAAFILLLLSVFDMNSTIATAYIDLISGKAQAYDAALNERYTYLQNSGCDTCALAPLPAIPQSLYFMDALDGEANSKFWVNADLARYWHKSSVFLTSPNPEIVDNVTTLREAGKSRIQN
ncbi:DUF6056 family protein [Pontibacter sp. E15-1]|uniref:DUF6056 family protein n=1 Tax=Pontibacter sp. E15-1 TaxID=2919918 RepID=UPI001F4FC164|nr:DUF6056 family protein [Pontibacter sp. E15-1]MCJ8165923.1 DUF6056 family protein [Pontibacter sp. E15-1]